MRRLKTSELASHQGSWLIFDFGNVLIEIDPARSIEAFQTLGAEADLHLDADFFHDFETGILSAAGFRDALRGQLAHQRRIGVPAQPDLEFLAVYPE